MLQLFIVLNLFLGLANLLVFSKLGVPQYFLWFCNHQAFVYAWAFWKKNPRWISAEVSLGLIPQLLWMIDYVVFLLTGNFLWGITEYMFVEGYAASTYYLSLQHIFLPVMALIALYQIGRPSLRDWQLTLVHVVVLVLLTVLFTAPEYNVNCVFKNACVPFLSEIVPWWLAIWGSIVLVMTVVTNGVLFFVYTGLKR